MVGHECYKELLEIRYWGRVVLDAVGHDIPIVPEGGLDCAESSKCDSEKSE